MSDRQPLEALHQQRILSGIAAAASVGLRSLTVLGEVDSTNRFLLEGKGVGEAGLHVCVAETQTAGRGRRGRAWVSPAGANLYLSVLRHFAVVPESLQGLSLAVGVAVARAMQSLDVQGIAL